VKYEAREYQTFATEFILSHPATGIFLDMGLGKSVITLTAVAELLFDRFEIGRVLIIAPLRVARDTWPSELQKWDHLSHLRWSAAIGSEKERRSALSKTADVYLINRENVKWLISDSGLPFHYDMIVVDELSSFKSHKSERFRALRKARPSVRRIVGLTGTPSSNGLMDLWAEIGLLDMGERLGRYIGRYRDTYFVPDKRNMQQVFSYKPRENAENEIYQKISDITISMRSEDHVDMPERIDNIVYVQLSNAEMALYKELRRELILQLPDGEIDAKSAGSLTVKLLQMANGAVYSEDGGYVQIHDRKLDALEDLLEAANGKPVMVAYSFRHDLDRIRLRFPMARVIRASNDIRDWNEGRIPLALIHPDSAGYGLNLQNGGSTLIWFGLPWKLEAYQQTNFRLYRSGQPDACVVVHHILAKGTLDERVLLSLQEKNASQSALLDAVRADIRKEAA